MLNTFQYVLIYESGDKGYCTKGYLLDMEDDGTIQYECESGIEYCSDDEIVDDPKLTGIIKDGLFEILI